MLKRNLKMMSALPKLALPLAAVVLVTGCRGWHGEVDDVYMPPMHYQRYPIEVAMGSVKLDVPVRSGRLSPAQEDAVVRFAQQARSHNASRVYVRRSSGSVSADVVAGKVTQILARQGISPAAMSHSTFNGAGPVRISYSRHFATTAQCGDWSSNLAATSQNEPYANLGCSQQHNIAAMVANPKDLITPRTSTAPDATRRGQVLTDYRTPKNTATPVEDSDKVEVSDVK